MQATAWVCVYFGYLPFLHPLFDQVGSPTVAPSAHAQEKLLSSDRRIQKKRSSSCTGAMLTIQPVQNRIYLQPEQQLYQNEGKK